jgi:hypothetical protein
MNCILTIDSVASGEVVALRLGKESHGDVLRLAAMDWVQRYRMRNLLPVMRRLSGPGHNIPVRTKSFETLLVLHEAPETLLETLLGWLDEPQAGIRGWAASALRLFGEDEARRILRPRAQAERHPQVRAVFRQLYGL